MAMRKKLTTEEKKINASIGKKDIKYLNVCIDRSIHEEFEEFCKDMGMSKTGATEKALRMYMDKVKRAMKNI